MAILHSELKKKPDSFYSGQRGSFFVESVSQWYGCREVFHDVLIFVDQISFYYWTENGISFGEEGSRNQKREDVVRIVNEAEILTDTDVPAEFWYCEKSNNLLYCKPGSWWVKDPCRFNMLTILLRTADERSILDLIDNNHDEYFTDTINAVKKFFSGYTHFQGECFYGWVNTLRKDTTLLGNKPSRTSFHQSYI